MQDFEKLGVFYLGRIYDLEQSKTRNELLLYDSKDLTTHAVCVGMTGSGKTGLGISLLEEAAIDGIPALGIAADPIRSREHILVSNILQQAWAEGRNLDIESLIREIQDPPFDRVGVFELDEIYGYFPPTAAPPSKVPMRCIHTCFS